MTPSTPSVRAVVARYAEATADNRVFFHPDIPEHRLASALTAYPGIAPEGVLVLLDNTDSGDATEGLLLTGDVLHVSSGPDEKQELDIRDLRSAGLTHQPSGTIMINRMPVLTELRVRPGTMRHVVAMLNELATASRA
jgi:hypothetical protein